MSIPVLESGLVSQHVISEEIEKIQAGAAAGQTQPRLDFAPYRSAVLRHPARDLRYATRRTPSWSRRSSAVPKSTRRSRT